MPIADPEPDWAVIRHAYEDTDTPAAEICRTHGIGKADLARAARHGSWRRKFPRPFPPLRTPSAGERTDPPLPAAPRRAEVPNGGSSLDGEPPQGAAASTRRKPAARTAASPPDARRKLLDRLVAAISLKLEQLERRMAQDLDRSAGGEASTATDHERETRAIGALIDNLGKVTEMESGLDRAAAGTSGNTPAGLAGEADRWRRELAQRLQRIVGGTAAGS